MICAWSAAFAPAAARVSVRVERAQRLKILLLVAVLPGVDGIFVQFGALRRQKRKRSNDLNGYLSSRLFGSEPPDAVELVAQHDQRGIAAGREGILAASATDSFAARVQAA